MTGEDRGLLQPRVLFPFIAITLIWGSTWLVITGQLGIVPPAWSVTYRFIIGATLMFAYSAATGASLRIGRDGHLLALLFGIPQFCLNFNCVYMAEQHVTSGLVAVVFALLLVPNSILAWIFLGKRIDARFAIGSLVAVAGVALLFAQELRTSTSSAAEVWLGIGITVAGVLSASCSNVIQAAERLRSRDLPPMVAWGMVYGVAADALLAITFEGRPTFEWSFNYIAGLLYLGIFASAIAFTLYFAVIRAVGPGRAAYSSLIVPVIAMALSTIFEGYRWSLLAAGGGMLALMGLFIALKARRADAAKA